MEVWLSVIRHCDTVLFDVKETDPEGHLRYTGVPLDPIMENLGLLKSSGIPFVIRAPIIPTLNDRDGHFKALRKLGESEGCLGVQIMPYHTVGEYKYSRLGIPYPCGGIAPPTKETADVWQRAVDGRASNVQ